ncbi:hypothetical protein R6Z07F_018357 [Ovis aries]
MILLESESYKDSLRDPVVWVLWEHSVERRRLPDGDAPRGWQLESALIRPGAPPDVVPRTSHSDENSQMPMLTTRFYQEAFEFQDCLGHLWTSEQGWRRLQECRSVLPSFQQDMVYC